MLSAEPNKFGDSDCPVRPVSTAMSADATVIELDVRTIDGEPFPEITSALEALDREETLRLVGAFEPVPLYDVLEARGFTYETERVDTDTWHVTIQRE